MTDTTPATVDPVFDTSTAAGRLRILWGATADPQLAMSDNEIADIATVLREHAEMAAELERLRAELVLDRSTLHGLLVAAYRNGWANRGQVIYEAWSRADDQRGFFIEQFKDRATEWIAELNEADADPQYEEPDADGIAREDR